jgi:hypothetical protein
MPSFIAQVMLQDVKNEEAYKDLDKAMLNEDGYSYITGEEDKMYALVPDTYEFDLEDTTAEELLKIVKLVCAQIEKKHHLKKTPILVYEVKNVQFAHLEELSDGDFEN